ncbi:MAG: GspE/PulE family protein [Patescibacteria group bacterium]|nr:GspE/PulE family protein [Patescibacteria group bacterium]
MFNNKKFLSLLKIKKILPDDKFLELENLSNKDKNFNLEDFLIRQKYLNNEDLVKVKAEVYNLPYRNLVDEKIPDNFLETISEDLSKNYLAICFLVDEQKMSIGLVEPNLKAMEALNFLANGKKLKVEYYLISKNSFNSAFRQYKKMEEEISSALEIKSKSEGGEDLVQVKREDDKEDLNVDDANSAPVAKIVSVIIKNAIDSRASDIHVEPYEGESRVRYRIDGILKNALFLPKNIHGAVVARIKVMAKMKLDETRVPQDGRIVLVLDNREIDFRISTLPVGSGKEKVVMRILDTAKGVIGLDELGFNSYVLDVFRKNVKKTNGIILVTGPTGSGKTTTLYSILNILNKEGVNISTLEDPIEYQLKGINQSQIRPKIGYSFATGLRSLVRQDPDVIMVGEIRDEETVELSIHAGLTGHLVLSTIHTNDAIGTIFRLIDMKAEPVLLCSILRIVIAQRLSRRLCENCKKEADKEYREKFMNDALAIIKDVDLDRLKQELPGINGLDDIKNIKIYQPVGCSKCQNSGYLDRVSIGEVIEIDDNLKDIIMNKITSLNVENIRKSQKFVSLKQDGFLKVLKGITNIEEVLRVIEM